MKRMFGLLVGMLTVALLAGGALAQDSTEIRHPTARKALIRAQQETRKAEQVYRQALIRIHRDLVRELEQAKREAMQSHLLEEANAIQAAIDAARQELDRLEGKPVMQTFTIDAAQSWQPTIEVRAGQRVEIVARGRWTASKNSPAFTSGPDGIPHPRTKVHSYYLEGRLAGTTFPIGSKHTFIADTNGTLEMQQAETGSRDDNEGSVSVSIRISE